MPFRGKMGRPTRRYRKTYRKYTKVSRPVRSKYALGRVFSFKRSHGNDISVVPIQGQGFFSNVGIPWTAGAGDSFQLDDLTHYDEFTALFDSYKIVGVKMTFTFGLTVVTLGSTTAAGGATMVNAMPMLYWVLDHDDSTVPASLPAMREYESFKMRRLDKPFSIFIRPKAAAMVYNTPVTTAYQESKGWMDCGNADIDYFGIKFCLDPILYTQTSSIGTLRVDYTYYMKFKNVK